MSFLYKALLKDSAKTNQNEPLNLTGNPAQVSMFAQAQSSSVPSAVWILIAGLLLIIGLMGGYLLGLSPSFTNHPQQLIPLELSAQQANNDLLNNTPAKSTNNTINDSGQPQNSSLKPSVDKSVNDVNGKVQIPHEEANVIANSMNVAGSKQQNDTEADAPAKQIKIGKNAQGELVTSVTEPGNVAQNNALEDLQQETLTTANSNDLPVTEVSEDLRSQFAMAVEATESLPLNSYAENNISSGSSLMSIHELSDAEKAGIPPLYYGMHIFATDPNERWVKINNQVLKEGDNFMPGLRLLEIRQDIVVWETHFTRFMQEALDDFEG